MKLRMSMWVAMATFALGGCSGAGAESEIGQSDEAIAVSPSNTSSRVIASAVVVGQRIPVTLACESDGRRGTVSKTGPDGGECSVEYSVDCSYRTTKDPLGNIVCQCEIHIESMSGDCTKDGLP